MEVKGMVAVYSLIDGCGGGNRMGQCIVDLEDLGWSGLSEGEG